MKNKTVLKRIITAAIAFIIVFVMVMGMLTPFIFGAEQQTPLPGDEASNGAPSIVIDGKMGFSGRYKLLNSTPFTIHLTNSGGHFKGKLQIKIDTSDSLSTSRYNIYATPVELPPGGSKLVEMEIPISTLKPFQTVVLLDEKGKEAASKKLYASGISPENVFVAALTDNRDGLNYFRQLELNNYVYDSSVTNHKLGINLVFLDESAFPTTAAAMNNFNMIVIDDYDTGKLLESQRTALTQWVKTGGVLVLGTGAGYEKVMKGIGADIVETTLEGDVQMSDLSAINGIYNLKIPGEESITLQKIDVVDAENFTNSNEDKFSSIFYNELGSVIVHPFDLAVEPFVSLEGRDRFLSEFYRSQLDYKINLRPNYYYQDWSYLTSNLPSLNEGSIVAVFIIILIYSVLIGPVLYLVLKKKDIREKGFAVIPVIAVLVTVAITVITSDTAYKKSIINSVTKIDLENKNGVGQAASTTGVFSPAKGNISVSFSQNIPIAFNPQNYYYGGMYTQNLKNVDLVELEYGETPKITFFDTASWATNSFTSNGAVNVNEGFECNFYLEGDVLKGTLANHTGYDFPEIIIGLKNSLKKYDLVKNGDVITVDQKVKFDDQYYDIYGAFSSLYGNVYDPASKLSAEEKRKIYFKQNLVGNLATMNYNRVYSPQASTMTVASQTVSYAVSSAAQPVNQIVQKPVYVTIYGFNYDKLDAVDVKVNDKTVNEYHTNLFLIEVPLDISTMKTFNFPYGLIDISAISTSVPYDYQEREIYMRERGDLALTFTLLKDAKMEMFQINWETNFGSKEIYNVAEEAWEPLETTAYDQNPHDYIDGDGNITIRLQGAESGYVPVPQIRLKGGQ